MLRISTQQCPRIVKNDSSGCDSHLNPICSHAVAYLKHFAGYSYCNQLKHEASFAARCMGGNKWKKTHFYRLMQNMKIVLNNSELIHRILCVFFTFLMHKKWNSVAAAFTLMWQHLVQTWSVFGVFFCPEPQSNSSLFIKKRSRQYNTGSHVASRVHSAV